MKSKLSFFFLLCVLFLVPSLASAQVSKAAMSIPSDVQAFVTIDLIGLQKSPIYAYLRATADKQAKVKKIISEVEKSVFDIEKDLVRLSMGVSASKLKKTSVSSYVVLETSVDVQKLYDKILADKGDKSLEKYSVQKFKGINIYVHENKKNVFAPVGKLIIASEKLENVQAYIDNHKAKKKTLLKNKAIARQIKHCKEKDTVCVALLATKDWNKEFAKKDPVYQISKTQADGSVVKGEKFMVSEIKAAAVRLDVSKGLVLSVAVTTASDKSAAADVAVINDLIPQLRAMLKDAMPSVMPLIENVKVNASGKVFNASTSANAKQVDALLNEIKALMSSGAK